MTASDNPLCLLLVLLGTTGGGEDVGVGVEVGVGVPAQSKFKSLKAFNENKIEIIAPKTKSFSQLVRRMSRSSTQHNKSFVIQISAAHNW